MKNHIFLEKWKERALEVIRLRYPNASKKTTFALLDKLIENRVKDKDIILYNNYTNRQNQTTILSMIDFIEEKKLIIGGAGVLFQQHGLKMNAMIPFIEFKKEERTIHKDIRKTLEKGTYAWVMEDIAQNGVKTTINALYGATGYPKFPLYNRFLAESTTNTGRQIITTAVMTFENFLTGSIKLNTENEVYQMINNICKEIRNVEINCDPFHIDNLDFKLYDKILNICEFSVTNSFKNRIKCIIDSMSYEEKILCYYKNNLYEFSRTEPVRQKLKFIVENVGSLLKPSIKSIIRPDVQEAVNALWELYEFFVYYDYPIFDRVRKAIYTDRTAVLYVDTDSNFLALDKWVRFIANEILEDPSIYKDMNRTFISVNLINIVLSNIIDTALHTMCYKMNITKEFADLLGMKNEFYLSRMIFTPVKKRYISNAILQEGDLLKNGLGMEEIKGFDFKKATTKAFVTDYFTQICLDDILRVDEINLDVIYLKLIALREDINKSIDNGENKYYKQADVKIMDHYKKPYSQQGIRGILLWNTLNPIHMMELPTDVDIIPIIDLGGKTKKTKNGVEYVNKKNLDWFKSKYPEAYDRLKHEILDNPNPLISSASFNVIAKPKNTAIELPDWLFDIVDREKIIMDIEKLFYPILESLGMYTLKTSNNNVYMTNIVDL